MKIHLKILEISKNSENSNKLKSKMEFQRTTSQCYCVCFEGDDFGLTIGVFGKFKMGKWFLLS